MVTILVLIILLSIILLIVGLIKPSLVIRWGEEEGKTRKQVVKLFLALFITANVIGVLTADGTSNKNKGNKEKVETQVASEKDGNKKDGEEIIKNEDGSITRVLANGYKETEYPDGSREYISGTLINKQTAKYRNLDIAHIKQMKSEEIEKIIGEELSYKLISGEPNYYNRENARIFKISQKHGYEPTPLDEKDNGVRVKMFRTNGKSLSDIEWEVEIWSKADIRKANPDLVATEMLASLRHIINELPNYCVIELQTTLKNDLEENDGDLGGVSLTYYKDLNAIVKSYCKRKIINGEKGLYTFWDVVE